MIASINAVSARLNSPANVLHKLKGAGRGGPSIPPAIEEISAGLVIEGEKRKEIAKVFDISTASVGNAFNGKGNLTEGSKNRIAERRASAHDQALEKLIDTLGLINQEKLEECNAVSLSMVASNMTKVIEKLEGRNSNSNNVLIVYAPRQKEEREFKTISL